MKVVVQVKVGGTLYNFNIEENKELEALNKAIVLGNPPQFCNLCKNNNFFKLASNKDKEGNIYVNVVCLKCGAKAKLGSYKTGSYFWHKFEQYERKAVNPEVDPAAREEVEGFGL